MNKESEIEKMAIKYFGCPVLIIALIDMFLNYL